MWKKVVSAATVAKAVLLLISQLRPKPTHTYLFTVKAEVFSLYSIH